jgi:hypothetical protein
VQREEAEARDERERHEKQPCVTLRCADSLTPKPRPSVTRAAVRTSQKCVAWLSQRTPRRDGSQPQPNHGAPTHNKTDVQARGGHESIIYA